MNNAPSPASPSSPPPPSSRLARRRPGVRARHRHPERDRRRLLHDPDLQRPARLRRLGHHQGRYQDARRRHRGHADPQPLLRRREGDRQARPADHRRGRRPDHRGSTRSSTPPRRRCRTASATPSSSRCRSRRTPRARPWSSRRSRPASRARPPGPRSRPPGSRGRPRAPGAGVRGHRRRGRGTPTAPGGRHLRRPDAGRNESRSVDHRTPMTTRQRARIAGLVAGLLGLVLGGVALARTRGRALIRRLLAALGCSVPSLGALVWLTGAPAAAHASLLSTDPEDGAVVTRPRTRSSSPSTNRSGSTTAPCTPSGPTARTGRVAPRHRQPPCRHPRDEDPGTGTVVVAWKVISADGHEVGGALTFSVGAPSANPPCRRRRIPRRSVTPLRSIAGGVSGLAP